MIPVKFQWQSLVTRNGGTRPAVGQNCGGVASSEADFVGKAGFGPGSGPGFQPILPIPESIRLLPTCCELGFNPLIRHRKCLFAILTVIVAFLRPLPWPKSGWAASGTTSRSTPARHPGGDATVDAGSAWRSIAARHRGRQRNHAAIDDEVASGAARHRAPRPDRRRSRTTTDTGLALRPIRSQIQVWFGGVTLDVFRRILPFLKPYRKQLAFGLGALVLAIPLTLFHPLVWMFITDEVALNGKIELLLPALGVMIGVHLLGVALSALHRNLLEKVGQRFVVDLRLAVYEKLQRQSVAYFHENRTGDLLSRAMNDIDAMQQAIIQGIDQVLSAFLRFIVVVTAVLSIQPLVGTMTLIPLVIVFFLVRIFNRYVKSLYRSVRDRLGDVSAQLQENLAGQLVVKAFAQESQVMDSFRATNRTYIERQDKAVNARTVFLPSVQFIGFLSSVVMIGMGAWFVVQGTFTIGGLVAYRGYWWQLYSPVDTLATVNELLQRAVAAGSRVFELLDADESVADAPDAVALEHVRGDLEFDRIRFAYGEETVLHDVSLTVPAGQTVAFVGPSGAGKTTMLHLVPRFFDPMAGAVRVDGHDLRSVQQRSLRRHMAMVLQETVLFSGTIADNIRFARPDATDEEVREAAAMANAHEFIERLPDGYETAVGERGMKLSGGQRQRISIARAFLADPRILVLDEATSAVEPESEWIIQQTLERLMKGRTTLITSHRLSMVRHADVIVALDGGRIVEMGSHDELMARRGLYHEMYTLQVGHLAGAVPEAVPGAVSESTS